MKGGFILGKPILFNNEMVRAILEGRKTQTRRVIKDTKDLYFLGFAECSSPKRNEGTAIFSTSKYLNEAVITHIKPKYQVGDILWVQETWKVDSVADHLLNMAIDFKAVLSEYIQAEKLCDFTSERYKKFRKFYQKNGWQSPYFMPREAARIFLKVANVKVQRIQDITPDECLKEGIKGYSFGANAPDAYGDNLYTDPKLAFKSLWDNLYKKKGYGWDANPWVWVYSFERLEGYNAGDMD